MKLKDNGLLGLHLRAFALSFESGGTFAPQNIETANPLGCSLWAVQVVRPFLFLEEQ
jgi:hypothetical protein